MNLPSDKRNNNTNIFPQTVRSPDDSRPQVYVPQETIIFITVVRIKGSRPPAQGFKAYQTAASHLTQSTGPQNQ